MLMRLSRAIQARGDAHSLRAAEVFQGMHLRVHGFPFPPITPEVLMSRISPLHLVNAALLAGVMLSVSDVVAQQTSPNSGGSGGERTLVYTACQMGELTKCGSEPVRQNCTFSLQIDLDVFKRSGGFKFGGETCTDVGTKDLFKDFYKEAPYGFCYVVRRTPPDATRREDDGSEEQPETGSSC